MRICVYCGSATGRGERFARVAREVGEYLAKNGIGLVYGGATVGTMGIVADGALSMGGEVIGVLPENLTHGELPHRGLTDLRLVGTMHERKALMAELSDGFIALPGGAGTLDELAEIWTWAQLGMHDKPIGLLNVDGFYDPLMAFVDRMVDEEFLRPGRREMLLLDTDIDRLVQRFRDYVPPQPKWS
ncbi:TIGR00730 family Rossman fold protein [Pseudonocardiaceae bacterium YIM PH 21723]|nr:TIGR00730 family Rossman fold protein [Pseudonocardiaceae bacterium YIM PH 21723]